MKTAVKLDAITPGVIAIPAIEVFRERCEARAILVEACLFDLQDAVDGFQEAAVASGLVEEVGQDAVQKMMAEAFAKFSSRDENLAKASAIIFCTASWPTSSTSPDATAAS